MFIKPRHGLLLVLCSFMLSSLAWAEANLVSETLLADSEEPYSRRIYGYDLDLDAAGTAHMVYSQPVAGQNYARIIYTWKTPGQSWNTANQRVLENQALLGSISTHLLVDKNSGTVHICYIIDRPYFDANGFEHQQGLVYQTVSNGVASAQTAVSSGGFHSRMQLNESGQAVFARETELFEGRQPPFPKALKLLIPEGDGQWREVNVEGLPSSEQQYRLADFVYDPLRGRYHLTYGDKDPARLRDSYPSTNPGMSPSGVYFPPGSGHNLRYAFSDDAGQSWTSSGIDLSGNLSENEFWTDLKLAADGTPYASVYQYATNASGIHEGTSNLIGHYDGASNSWSMNRVAGLSSPQHRAGMGAGLFFDAQGGLHGVWDNSPDKPIDADGTAGNLMYRYSSDGGLSWKVFQALRPYSVEGFCRVRLHGNLLSVLALVDATNARLVLLEFALPGADTPLLEVSANKRLYAPGEAVQLHARMQPGLQGDWYAVIAGPSDKQADGSLQPAPFFQLHYLDASLSWLNVANLPQLLPALVDTPLLPFNADFSIEIAASAGPFQHPGTYTLYSVVSQPSDMMNWQTPLFQREVHVCAQAGCAEIQ